ncbi:MAG: 2,3-bisphosphoglycerate-independent phosphoglycerate mutase [Alphaproteobacteria bacterium]|nr:2,3-bisphosphoglycerate-independent phosphoglycerate mutase [Alphaproteobacteria bacterium]
MTPQPRHPRPVVLCVLDGWGHREESADNAVAQAATPEWDRLRATCPHALLQASGLDVGLPDDQFGNSEVGHLSIGAGRVVMQDLPRINAVVADGSLGRAPAVVGLIRALEATGGTCHLLGLLSPGGVHAHQTHIAALARILDAAGVGVAVHAFLDGRDTPPSSAVEYLRRFRAETAGLVRTRIATVGGRYYAMDRDRRWDRVARAYAALAAGQGVAAADPVAAVQASYAGSVTDEFMPPAVLPGHAGMRDGDGLVMANFRADRAREILTALLDPGFADFPRPRVIRFAAAVGMTEYSSALNRRLATIFPAQTLTNVLGDVVAKAGLRQLRIAETEKYAHVTFFLNGGEETEYPGEERILVPSPKVATYDLQPEMSAVEVTDKLVAAVASGRFDLIVVNYANTDMVGHTGILDAARRAVEAVDRCLGRLRAAVEGAGGALLITADHGNADLMRDPTTGEPHTAHTFSPVPVILAGAAGRGAVLRDGRLADVAPTVLALMGLPQPAEMTGQSLIQPAPARRHLAMAAGD